MCQGNDPRKMGNQHRSEGLQCRFCPARSHLRCTVAGFGPQQHRADPEPFVRGPIVHLASENPQTGMTPSADPPPVSPLEVWPSCKQKRLPILSTLARARSKRGSRDCQSIWKGPWVPGLLWQRTNARLRPNGQGAEL